MRRLVHCAVSKGYHHLVDSRAGTLAVRLTHCENKKRHRNLVVQRVRRLPVGRLQATCA